MQLAAVGVRREGVQPDALGTREQLRPHTEAGWQWLRTRGGARVAGFAIVC